MIVNIFCCGTFHYKNWLSHLSCLNKFYCSTKIGNNSYLETNKVKNLFLKEYIRKFHQRYLFDFQIDKIITLYHNIWEQSAMRHFENADITFCMLHGNCTKILQKSKNDGSITIGEAVNAHSKTLSSILNNEHKSLGIAYNENHTMLRKTLIEYELCDYILVASSWVRKSFIENGFPEEKIIFEPYPVPVNSTNEKFRKLIHTGKPIKIICIGLITPRKGQFYLLKALSKLRIPVELTLVGEISNIKYFKKLKSLEFDFTHIPRLEHEEIFSYLEGFDLFVLPSVEDGNSVVVSEALSVGLPVITTNNNGAADLIKHGQNGFIIPAQNVEALIDAIVNAHKLNNNLNFDLNVTSSWSTYAKNMEKHFQKVFEMNKGN